MWNEKRPKNTPVIFTTINNQDIVIKDESKNITNTYKDKHGWMMGLHYLTNIYPNNYIYYLGSTGNAGIADFLYADMLNDLLSEQKIKVVNFYPLHYDFKELGPDSKGRFTNGKIFREDMQKYKSGILVQVDFKEQYWFGSLVLIK